MAVGGAHSARVRGRRARRLHRCGFHRDYDIAPDAERFLMSFSADQTESSEPDVPQINIVLNWFEELKERVPVE